MNERITPTMLKAAHSIILDATDAALLERPFSPKVSLAKAITYLTDDDRQRLVGDDGTTVECERIVAALGLRFSQVACLATQATARPV